MAAFGVQRAGDVFVVLPHSGIIELVHSRISVKGAAELFRGL
jgi:hypothetical protein